MKRGFLIVLGVAEVVVFAVAAGAVGFFLDQLHDGLVFDFGYYGRHECFLLAVGVGFLVTFLSLAIAIANLQGKAHWALTMAALHVFSAITVLVSGALLAKTTTTYDSRHVCDSLHDTATDARCYQLIIGIVFGFVAIVLFFGDTVIYIVSFAEDAEISFLKMGNAPV